MLALTFEYYSALQRLGGHATNIVVTHAYKRTKILHHPSVTPFICLCLNLYTMGIGLAIKVERKEI